MKKLNSVKEVTHDWVKKNFSIDKERKSKTMSSTPYFLDKYQEGTFVFDEWVEMLRSEAERLKKQANGIPEDALLKIIFDYDYYDDQPFCCQPPEISLFFEWEQPETDTETIRRLAAREKQKVKRRIAQEAQKKRVKQMKKDVEQKERALLDVLLKKYPDVMQ